MSKLSSLRWCSHMFVYWILWCIYFLYKLLSLVFHFCIKVAMVTWKETTTCHLVMFFLQWSLTSYLDRVSLFNVTHKWIISLSWNLPMVTGWAGSVSVAAPAPWSTWPSPCSGRVDRWPWWVSPRNPFMWRMFFRTSVCKEKIKHLCMPLSCTSAPSIVKFACS